MDNTSLPADVRLDIMIREAWIWLDVHTVRILLGLAAGALIVGILYGAKLVGKKLSKSAHPWWRVAGGALATMRLWFMAAAAAKIVAIYAYPPDAVAATITFLFTIAATFQAAIFVRELILGAVEIRAGAADPHGSLSSAIGLIRLAITLSLFIIAVVLILSNLGVNVTGLIAGLGVGGIAIGLAAQGIFSDLFAALAILFDKPFRRGDSIKWEKGGGIVEYIGLKSTRMRAPTGEEVIVSNKNLLDKDLFNVTQSERRRISQAIGLVYQTPPDVCERLPGLLKELVETDDDRHFMRCSLENFGDSSLDFTLVYDVGSHDIQVISEHKHAVNIAILKRFTQEGIDFAYPTQVGLVAGPDGKVVPPHGDG